MFWLANNVEHYDMDLGFLDLKANYVGERKISRKTKAKRRDRNAQARKSRTKNRQKGLGKVKMRWSPGPNGRGQITEHQSRN